jgi:antitoxin ParD1/3/4
MEEPMATMNVSLPELMKAWVERQATGGRYGNASDYVRDLIRKDQQRAEAIAALQAAITEGVESGEPQPLDVDAFKLRMRERHAVR